MVHFLRRKDSNSSTKDGNQVSTKSSSSSRNGLFAGSSNLLNSINIGSGYSVQRSKDSKVLLDYMVEKLPKMDAVTFSWDPLFSKVMNNPCGALDISSMPKDFMTYYDNFSASSLLSEGSYPFDCSADSSDCSNEGPGRLRFGSVEVREYNRTVGDHPDVSDPGPPLTLNWDYVQLDSVPVCQYEARKQRRRKRRLERRNQRLRMENKREVQKVPNMEFMVPRIKGHIRRELLQVEYGVSPRDIAKAEEEVRRVAQQREESNSQSALAEKTEELFEAAARKLKRSFLFGSGNKPSGGLDREIKSNYDDLGKYWEVEPKESFADRRQPRKSKASVCPEESSVYKLSHAWEQAERSSFHQPYSYSYGYVGS